MAKYHKVLLIGLASIVLTITGFCIRGLHRGSHLGNQTDNMAPPSQGTISAVKSDEQSCWRPGSTRNIGVAELSCDLGQ